MRKMIAITIGILLIAGVALGNSLIWNANSEPDLAGYKVYILRHNEDTVVADVGNVTTVDFATLGVQDNKGYSFFVTAYDTSENESLPSRIVTDKKPRPGYPTGLSVVRP